VNSINSSALKLLVAVIRWPNLYALRTCDLSASIRSQHSHDQW
jgi:hypothetical protein